MALGGVPTLKHHPPNMKKINKIIKIDKKEELLILKPCQQCGRCCTNMVSVKIEGMKFLPFNSKTEAYPFICENFDMSNNKCKIHDSKDRPEKCAKFFCNGSPHYMNLPIEGVK
jgi:hypothetical protein